MKTIKAGIITLLFCLIAPAVAWGQGAPGRIKGVVRDLEGKPIVDATVYGTDTEIINHRITTTTDSSGNFRFTNVPAGTYDIRAFKVSDGYADTFFGFFDVGNDRNWKRVRLDSGGTTEGVAIYLGPKYATLKLEIFDQNGISVGAGIYFTKPPDVKRIYGVGVAPNPELLVPPVPFRFEIEKEGYEIWRSKLIRPGPGRTVFLWAQLKLKK